MKDILDSLAFLAILGGIIYAFCVCTDDQHSAEAEAIRYEMESMK